ncbi:hypothetical protein Tco_0043100 [Tanacetum coccineum]
MKTSDCPHTQSVACLVCPPTNTAFQASLEPSFQQECQRVEFFGQQGPLDEWEHPPFTESQRIQQMTELNWLFISSLFLWRHLELHLQHRLCFYQLYFCHHWRRLKLHHQIRKVSCLCYQNYPLARREPLE